MRVLENIEICIYCKQILEVKICWRFKLTSYIGQSELDELVQGKIYDHIVVRRLINYALPYYKWGIWAVIGMIGHIFSMSLQPLIIAWAIDGFIVPSVNFGPNWMTFNLVCASFFGIIILNMLSNYLQYYSLARLSVRVLADIRKSMFDHLQRQSTAFFDRTIVGRIMSRVQNDVNQLEEFMDIGIITVGDIAMLGCIIAIMFFMNPFLALVTLSTFPILIGIMIYWQMKSKPIFVKVRTAISSVNASLQENISGVRVTQSMNRQDKNLYLFDELNAAHRDAAIHAAKLSAILLPVVDVLTIVSMGLVIIVGGLMVFEGTLELGFLVAFLLYIQRLFEPVRVISMQYTVFQRAMASGGRIFELLDIHAEMKNEGKLQGLVPSKGHIQIEHVGFHYDNGKTVLEDINVDIPPSTSIALVGLTGAGKTTLASLLSRLYDPTSGKIILDGYDITNLERSFLSNQISMVLQEPFLYSMTVRENICYNRQEITHEEIEKVTRHLGAHEFIMNLENGYDTVLQERGRNLSMGERQLISFCRAMVMNPRVLILDEATANIDSQSEKLIQDAMRIMLKNRTSIIIAHRISTIVNSDNIIVLESGRIVEMGNHEYLFKRNGRYRELYELNFQDE
ncbi:MAG: multidrug ABC transporter [Chloroflexi bacterium]|nr:multidrug ABC transporter [Chloroflexota bacterium]